MRSRDDYEFIIPPWEYPGADFDPRPDAIAEVVGTFRQQMMLKVKQNYLFVREAGDDPNRTYAVLQPLAKTSLEAEQLKSDPDLLLQIFREAKASKNLAKMHSFRVDVPRYFARDMVVVGFLRFDGRGVFREFWDDDGIPFKYTEQPIPHKLMWPQYWAAADEYIKSACTPEIVAALQDREVPPSVMDGEPLRWVCGSETELRRLITWLVYAVSNEAKTIVCRYIVNSPLYFENHFNLYAQSGSIPLPVDIQRLLDLFCEENLASGWGWNSTVKREADQPLQRKYCAPTPESFDFHIGPSTAHERLEAQLNLRDWLQGKLPNAEIQRLLS